jgi:hypothetical protein
MPRRVFPQPVKPSKINRIVTRQNCSRQHPYGVSTRSIAFVEPFATRGERMLCGVVTFRSDLVRFVRLIRTYLHQTIPHLGSARQLLEPSIPLPGCLPTLPRQAEGAYLACLAHFLQCYGPTHGGLSFNTHKSNTFPATHGGRNLRVRREQSQNAQHHCRGSHARLKTFRALNQFFPIGGLTTLAENKPAIAVSFAAQLKQCPSRDRVSGQVHWA